MGVGNGVNVGAGVWVVGECCTGVGVGNGVNVVLVWEWVVV